MLPEAMVPSSWTFLDALPLTPNGKLDRARLPEPRREGASFAPPRGSVQKTIAAIWSEALGVPRVGIHENFFDLGGHSLPRARPREVSEALKPTSRSSISSRSTRRLQRRLAEAPGIRRAEGAPAEPRVPVQGRDGPQRRGNGGAAHGCVAAIPGGGA
jgi:hypothetical protein